MTWDLARTRILEIVAGASPTVFTSGFGERFVHNKEANPYLEKYGPPRSFSLFALNDQVWGPIAGTRKRRADCELIVSYKFPRDLDAFDRALRADHKAIADALLVPADWQASTTGIVVIEGTGDAIALPAEVDIRGDVVLHRYRFAVVYRS